MAEILNFFHYMREVYKKKQIKNEKESFLIQKREKVEGDSSTDVKTNLFYPITS